MRARSFFCWTAVLAIVQGSAHALTPSEVFEKVAPAVWAVHALDGEQRPFSFGSGVVIGPGRMVTNCHVLAKAKAIQVRRENVKYEAKLEHPDVERDLCILSIPQLTAPAVEIAALSTVRIGNRVYVVGNPERLALTLSEGLISGLRSDDAKLPPIQTSAPISPGSSGGGLFDEQARLVGITTSTFVGRERLAQNLNFAVPAEWIRDVPPRAKEQLARRAERRSPNAALGAAPRVAPTVGATWTYSFREQRYRMDQVFTVRVTAVDGWMIGESIAGEGSGTDIQDSVDAQQLRFAGRLIGGRSIVEFSPYLLTPHGGEPPAEFGQPLNYPGRGAFRMRIESVEREEVSVPAGSFKAVRVEVSGERERNAAGLRNRNRLAVARFRYTTWYAPETGRYVKAHHQQWDPAGALTGDELVQLLEYRAN
jgi:serine protease Do